MHAAEQGHTDVCDMLLQSGCHTVTRDAVSSGTALHAVSRRASSPSHPCLVLVLGSDAIAGLSDRLTPSLDHGATGRGAAAPRFGTRINDSSSRECPSCRCCDANVLTPLIPCCWVCAWGGVWCSQQEHTEETSPAQNKTTALVAKDVEFVKATAEAEQALRAEAAAEAASRSSRSVCDFGCLPQ